MAAPATALDPLSYWWGRVLDTGNPLHPGGTATWSQQIPVEDMWLAYVRGVVHLAAAGHTAPAQLCQQLLPLQDWRVAFSRLAGPHLQVGRLLVGLSQQPAYTLPTKAQALQHRQALDSNHFFEEDDVDA